MNTDEGAQSGAEIVSASEDGKLLIYTDSQSERLGFVDIAEPGAPKPQGVLAMSGEPTSVAVSGPYALAVVDTSPSFSAPSGELVVVDLETRDILRRIDLGGQPDSIAVSPDRHYAAITIENERDEEADDGRPQVRFAAGNALEHGVTRIGHYPEDRSENKGNEPEGVEYGQYGHDRFLFVGSERSNVIAVYRIILDRPKLVQVLPAGVGAEDLLAIPSRGLLVVASEVDDAEVNVRSTITVYALESGLPRYPTIRSANRAAMVFRSPGARSRPSPRIDGTPTRSIPSMTASIARAASSLWISGDRRP